MATTHSSAKTTRKAGAEKPAAKTAKNTKSAAATEQSPISEMGAEDESASDAAQSKSRSAAAKKRAR
ncbi:MAG: hypothetical protein Q7T55_17305 [Solirubrobacteraceae bacterium]|nr:hypothetical protein [Solirubrobacteraceae bacterium]